MTSITTGESDTSEPLLVTKAPWLGGVIELRQFKSGQRAGTDAALLVASLSGVSGHLVDVGAGSGAIGLALAQKSAGLRVDLVEINPASAELARQNCRLNALANRVNVMCVDVLDAAACRRAKLLHGRADFVVSNPPFYQRDAMRAPNDAGKALAHVMPAGGLVRWIKACNTLLTPRGTMVMIHVPAALGDILAACSGRFGNICVRPVHANISEAALRIIIFARKGTRGPLRILPGFGLHTPNGAFTVEAEALHKGTQTLPWPYQ